MLSLIAAVLSLGLATEAPAKESTVLLQLHAWGHPARKK